MIGLTAFVPKKLATPDHSMTAMEEWDTAHFNEHDAHTRATKAREAYQDALRVCEHTDLELGDHNLDRRRTYLLKRSFQRVRHPGGLPVGITGVGGLAGAHEAVAGAIVDDRIERLPRRFHLFRRVGQSCINPRIIAGTTKPAH